MMIDSEQIFITGLSIKPHYSFAYSFNSNRSYNHNTTPIKHFHNSELSIKARRRIITAMQWMIFLSPNHSTYCKIQKMKFKFKLNFLTLTLSDVQRHSDKFIVHKMLRPMLKYLKRKGCTNYIWKAETQDNGNLHFHITTNHYIYWKSLRNKWNSLQHKYGYLKKYLSEHDDMNANSTDVHAVKNTKSIISYITKYMLKADKFKKNQSKKYNIPEHYYHDKLNETDPWGKLVKRYIECALWNCSSTLSKMKLNITEDETQFLPIMNVVKANSEIFNTEHGTMYTYKPNFKFNELYQMCEEAEYYAQ